MDTKRLAFFADLHIRRDKLQAQTDLGAPSRLIARKAQTALNDGVADPGTMAAARNGCKWSGG